MKSTVSLTGQVSAPAARALYLPEVATVDDIAEHLRMSPRTVRRMLRDRVLVGRKVGRRWFITRRALLGLVEGGVSGRLDSGATTPR